METRPDIPKRYHYPSPGFARYWREGRGKKLARIMHGRFPEEKEIRESAPWLLETDILADRVVREVMQVHGFQQVQAWIEAALNGSTSPDIPPLIADLAGFTMDVPAWLDTEKLEAGAAFCRRSGARGLIVLRNYCLMGGYESAAINKPLIYTGALKKGAAKRMAETTEFWVKVIGPHALQQTIGKKECINVRLMHAYARVSILGRTGWKTELWGQPLNQWDMVATNLGFSIVFLHGLRLLGMKPGDRETEGLFHLWKYIGYLLGIPAERLPGTEAEAVKMLYAWTITQPPADEDTQALARALMEEPLTAGYPEKEWQKRRVVQVHLAYNYFFLGKHSCEAMGLPVKGWTIYPLLLQAATSVEEFLNRFSKRARQSSTLKNRRIQERIAYVFLKGHGRK